MSGGEARAHVLALPFPEHGHVNPMLRFCGHLALQGVAITFVVTEAAQERMSGHHPWTSQLSGFRFATIPGGFHGDVEGGQSSNALAITLDLLSHIQRQRDVLRQMVVESRSSDLPVNCFLVDAVFLRWDIASLCDELRIRKAVFFTSCGWFFSFASESHPLLDAPAKDINEVNQTTSFGGIQCNAQELVAALPSTLRNRDIRNKFKEICQSLTKDTIVIFNSFEKLEELSVKATVSQAHVCYVGPVLPIDVYFNVANSKNNEEENKCLDWLNKHEENTVLYISFGSITCLNSNQLEALALGLQQSKRPFIWVMRNNMDTLPQGFVEKTQHQGLLVKWAPQIEVLGHPSIGGFFTHCGWNSIIESIYMGVPLLCFPCFGDQHINSFLVTKVWNLGIFIDKGKNPSFTRDLIQSSIDQLMNSKELQQRASMLKMYAHEAIKPRGSSHISMDKIITLMKQKL